MQKLQKSLLALSVLFILGACSATAEPPYKVSKEADSSFKALEKFLVGGFTAWVGEKQESKDEYRDTCSISRVYTYAKDYYATSYYNLDKKQNYATTSYKNYDNLKEISLKDWTITVTEYNPEGSTEKPFDTTGHKLYSMTQKNGGSASSVVKATIQPTYQLQKIDGNKLTI
ncbi:MAG: hypothetical protein ACRC0X_04840, partial [Brevinema sp.]